ncbi:hypothetical protein [Corynebacterium aquatimens]|uniref:Uncharacterized protein n=1 Tax=Corynebacterium aquatimens TaxID=1190508 RepID=A0A931E2Z3_9CORY|nr:hypothetical protein [Corynebacterium aquatimens]MBG6122635.1 hypothetical protein [Corynebacterium aquatimens]WJY64825.1 hypothetical protein CAQUA_00385 [Corynebacterium aquatimens]
MLSNEEFVARTTVAVTRGPREAAFAADAPTTVFEWHVDTELVDDDSNVSE